MIFDHRRVAIVGSRDFPNRDAVERFARGLRRAVNCTVISGGARGVDTWAADVVGEGLTTKVEIFPADWNRWPKAAGMIRNEQIARSADIVVAFWDGRSRGTKNTIDWAYRLRKSVLVIGPDGRIWK